MQASWIKNKCSSENVHKSTDPLHSLVVKFKQQHGNPDQYIQYIRLVPDLAVVLFNQKQLHDLLQFWKSECI